MNQSTEMIESSIRGKLMPSSTTEERMEAFQNTPIPDYMLGICLGTTVEEVEDIENGEIPSSADVFMRLDRLRYCLTRLMNAGFDSNRGSMIIMSIAHDMDPPISPLEAIAADEPAKAYEIIDRAILTQTR